MATSPLETAPEIEELGTRRSRRPPLYAAIVVFCLSLFVTAALLFLLDPWFASATPATSAVPQAASRPNQRGPVGTEHKAGEEDTTKAPARAERKAMDLASKSEVRMGAAQSALSGTALPPTSKAFAIGAHSPPTENAATLAEQEVNGLVPVQQPQLASIATSTKAIAPPLRMDSPDIALWMKRGEDAIAVGDFASARVALQRAAEAGDAQASLLLGSTYDPNVLNRFKAKGMAGEIAKARLWYEKARELGSSEARHRLQQLAGRTN